MQAKWIPRSVYTASIGGAGGFGAGLVGSGRLRCVWPVGRAFSSEPGDTTYYTLALQDMDEVFGPKRVESSRVEAVMRRIAQKLFLHDAAQQAMLEQEIKHDEAQFVRGQRLQYLRDFSDARDLAPRPLPTSQTRLARDLRSILQARGPTLVQDVAELLWKHPIRRRSTFQMVARELLRLGHGKAAQHVMESLLMAIKKRPDTIDDGPETLPTSPTPSGTSSTSTSTSSLGTPLDMPLGSTALALCLEIAMANNDHAWFLELSRAVHKDGTARSSQQKFSFERDEAVELLLAEGYMKFGHPHLLNEVIRRNRPKPGAPSRETTLYVRLLAVSMEAACRFDDEARAKRALAEFCRYFDAKSEAAVRFLLLARKHAATKDEAAALVPKLTPGKQRLYERKTPVWQYVHPYANPRTRPRTRSEKY